MCRAGGGAAMRAVGSSSVLRVLMNPREFSTRGHVERSKQLFFQTFLYLADVSGVNVVFGIFVSGRREDY